MIPVMKFDMAKKNWAKSMIRVYLEARASCSGVKFSPVKRRFRGSAKIKMIRERRAKRRMMMLIMELATSMDSW